MFHVLSQILHFDRFSKYKFRVTCSYHILWQFYHNGLMGLDFVWWNAMSSRLTQSLNYTVQRSPQTGCICQEMQWMESH